MNSSHGMASIGSVLILLAESCSWFVVSSEIKPKLHRLLSLTELTSNPESAVVTMLKAGMRSAELIRSSLSALEWYN